MNYSTYFEQQTHTQKENQPYMTRKRISAPNLYHLSLKTRERAINALNNLIFCLHPPFQALYAGQG